MSEIKQTNFRISTESADVFRTFCEQNGMNQAQGFDHIIQILEINNAKVQIPDRSTEIEEFERNAKALLSAFLNSLELAQNSELRIKEEFQTMLLSKDKQILDLQEKLKTTEELAENAKTVAKEYENAAIVAEKRLQDALENEKKARASLKDKEEINAMLTQKLTESELKVSGYTELKASESKLKETLATVLQEKKDLQKDASISQERAVFAVRQEMTEKISLAEKEKNEEIKSLYKQINNLQEEKSALKDSISDLKSEIAALIHDTDSK